MQPSITEQQDHHCFHRMRQAGLCSVAHLGLCTKFIAPSRRHVFTLQLKGKDRASGLKALSSWLQTAEIEVDALYRCLRWAVYPSNVQTAMRTPRDHHFLFCIQPSLLPFPQTHTYTHIKHLIHTNVCSAAPVRWRLPLHPSTRRWKTSERKRKKEVTKLTVKTTSSVFRNWILVSTAEFLSVYPRRILFNRGVWTLITQTHSLLTN